MGDEMLDFQNMDSSQLSEWYVENVGYDLALEDPAMSLQEYQNACLDMSNTIENEGVRGVEAHCADSVPSTEELEQKAREYAISNLPALCREILEWQKTGQLHEEDNFHELAGRVEKYMGPVDHYLQAERLVTRLSVELVANKNDN